MSLSDFDASVFKLGKLCKHGHDWNGTGQSLRHIKQKGVSNACRKVSLSKYNESDKGKKFSSIYYFANRDKIVKRAIDWNKANPEKARQRYKNFYYSEYGHASETLRKHKRRVAKMAHGHTIEFKKEELASIYKCFNNQCSYCGTTKNITIDHYKPLSKGGKHSVENIVLACSFCNTSKKDRDAEAWYTKQSFFCQKRWDKILCYVNKPSEFIQLKLFEL